MRVPEDWCALCVGPLKKGRIWKTKKRMVKVKSEPQNTEMVEKIKK